MKILNGIRKRLDDYAREKDFDWYVANYQSLYSKYGRCYLCIKDRSVINVLPVSSNKRSAHTILPDDVAEYLKNTPNPRGLWQLQYCDGTPDAYTFYHVELFSRKRFPGRCRKAIHRLTHGLL